LKEFQIAEQKVKIAIASAGLFMRQNKFDDALELILDVVHPLFTIGDGKSGKKKGSGWYLHPCHFAMFNCYLYIVAACYTEKNPRLKRRAVECIIFCLEKMGFTTHPEASDAQHTYGENLNQLFKITGNLKYQLEAKNAFLTAKKYRKLCYGPKHRKTLASQMGLRNLGSAQAKPKAKGRKKQKKKGKRR